VQSPQAAAFSSVDTHASPQSVVFAGQPQTLATQTPCFAQAVPQLPQCAGSVAVSTQVPPHKVFPPLQTHVPLVQLAPAGHVVSHPPQ
jgi:hypothetical protein